MHADVVASLVRALEEGRFTYELGERLRQLAVGMVDGAVQPPDVAASLRAAVIELVATRGLPELAARNPRYALAVLDVLAQHGMRALEPERAGLEAARIARFPPPAPPSWPELDELRELAAIGPALCTLGPPLRSADVVPALLDSGVLVPDELIALYAACDGLTLNHPGTGALALRISAADELHACPVGGARHALVIMWEMSIRGMHTTTTQLIVDGAPGRWRLGHAENEKLAGEQPFDLRALLRLGIRRARTGPPHQLPFMLPLAAELTWEDWRPRTIDTWVDALVDAGERERARRICLEQFASFADDEASCMRAGDFGEATRAEREKDRWAARLRALE